MVFYLMPQTLAARSPLNNFGEQPQHRSRSTALGAVVRLFLAILAVVLSGCASQPSKYVRADGTPVDAARERATMALCKGEAATTVTGNWFERMWEKEDTGISACMTRNGYIQEH